ncbi:MAG: GtrA family protein, partial [Chloroflexota bacterium]
TVPLLPSEFFNVTQAKPETVYAQIERDLNEAIPVLPESVPVTENGRATKLAAVALLGKVILFQNNESRMLEAAALFEMYGIQTGIKLDALYELCTYVQKAYGIQLPPWKPIVGANWNKEEGAGHHEGSADAESTIGIAPRVIGREFENVIGGKILFGRERSSAHTDDPVFLRDIVRDLGLEVSEEQFQRILLRSRAAVASNYRLNSWWTFRSREQRSHVAGGALFLFAALVGLAISEAGLWLVTTRGGLFYVWTKLGLVIVVFAWNYLFNNAITFRHQAATPVASTRR